MLVFYARSDREMYGTLGLGLHLILRFRLFNLFKFGFYYMLLVFKGLLVHIGYIHPILYFTFIYKFIKHTVGKSDLHKIAIYSPPKIIMIKQFFLQSDCPWLLDYFITYLLQNKIKNQRRRLFGCCGALAPQARIVLS